ncbi:MAG: hypothetical protein J6T22_04585 [Bacteroidales bacterium]|nr:hypothetical protein [Bacteroidales bacterium]
MKNIEETRRIIAECFQLTLSLDTFGDDTMGLLHVELVSDDFSAKVIMDVYVNSYGHFLSDMQNMYRTLRGEATIKELYGTQQALKFRMDDYGHVYVEGALASQGHNGHDQYIYIENDFDQTSLSDFE